MKNPNFGIITTFVIIGIVFTTTFTSCRVELKPQHFDVRVIDSCEYLEYQSGFGSTEVYSLTHKGNCKFCQIRNKK